ncbi:helix-turn-helix transcriptional regulator [Rhizobium sp. FY34]|uniref:helix-turn-helix domain-containing protein n=1 Tax=Rhizobium sp. FY34 TaxID=2562309 RepID=UPI0010C08BC4|nr:helix-turn-helix transcriptional regulator [Rhizobium sp. FY34]
MHKIQIITASNGEEMVVLPKADYDAMMAALNSDAEDDDVAIYDARKAELEAEGLLPAEVTIAILRGDHRIKALRMSRGLTQQQLATKTGLGQGFLSDLENGRRNVTDAVAQSLSTILGVPAAWFKG